MITHISVKNYALIKTLDLDLTTGLSVLTGETGSGKSIVLGALGLVLGERADIKSLANLDRKCIIEATFNLPQNIHSFFLKHDLDYHQETILRREINSSGKSRAFINDTPVNLAQLKELGSQLVEIHSQDGNTVLSRKEFQFEILDSFAQNNEEVKVYYKEYEVFNELNSKYVQLSERELQSKSDLDYLQFQLTELDESRLDYINKEDLESEMKLMSNSEEISNSLSLLSTILDQNENSVNSQLQTLVAEMIRKQDIHPNFQSLGERLNSVLIELQDILNESHHLNSSIEMDPNRLDQVQKILNELNHLENKHRVQSVEELIEIREELKTKLNNIGHLDSDLEQLENQILLQKTKIQDLSEKIEAKRKTTAPLLEKRINSILDHLGLNHASLKIELSREDRFNPYGKNGIEFLFKANPGSPFLPVQKVASGGEKSRVLLAMKKVFSDLAFFPTLILDEIDTGVSGEVALRVGDLMKEMSQKTQLICITHLPQIAGKGKQHYKVYKEVVGEETISKIQELNSEERVAEIAEMLSGKELNEAAKENARQLLAFE